MLHLSRLTTVWPRLSRAPSGLLLAGLLALGALLPGLSAAEDIRFGQGYAYPPVLDKKVLAKKQAAIGQGVGPAFAAGLHHRPGELIALNREPSRS